MALRELPCPVRIVDDFGGAFAMGCVAGSVIHFIRGCWYSPKQERLFGGLMLMKKRAPVLGGSFALWGGMFSSTECIMIYCRQKEDWINPVTAGFVTGGLLAIRAGTRIAFKNAIFGGIFLGCIQMVEIVYIKYAMRQQMQQQHEHQQMQKEMLLEEQHKYLSKYRPDLVEKRIAAKAAAKASAQSPKKI